MANWTPNSYTNALLEGYKITNSTINYHLSSAGGAWTATERAAFAAATEAWEEVANLEFQEVFSHSQAHFVEQKFYSADRGNLGLHYMFAGSSTNAIDEIAISTSSPLNGYFNWNGFGWDGDLAEGGLQKGGLGFSTLLHEIGHGLGLDHTHSGGASDPHSFAGVGTNPFAPGNNDLNDELYSIMSYRGGPLIKTNYGSVGGENYGHASGPMAFDIAAIQFLYGANTTIRTGDDEYILKDGTGTGIYWSSIWDAGGVDAITYAGTLQAVIDLREATLLDEPGGGGFVSRAGNTLGGFTVANGAAIENANGGSGTDLITGNQFANTLRGNAGGDDLTGLSGNDRLYGGADDDTLHGGDGNDLLNGGTQDDELHGGTGDDLMGGDLGNDAMFGEDGQDSLYGNAGSDRMYGGADDDLIFGHSDNDLLNGGTGNDLIYAGTGNDLLGGDLGNDRMYGEAGDDALYANSGNDLLNGGEGNDFLHGHNGSDLIGGGIGDDRAYGGNGNDRLYGNGGNDLLNAGSGNDILFGHAGNDTLAGGGGEDVLHGGTGDDYLIGNGGRDIFVFASDWGDDFVRDFENGLDKFDVSGVSGLTSYSQLSVTSSGGSVYIVYEGNEIRLYDTLASEIETSDFLF